MSKRATFPAVAVLIAIMFSLVLVAPVLAWHHNGWYWEQGPGELYFLIENNVSTESWVAWYNGHEEWNEAENSPTGFIYTQNPDIDLITCEYASGEEWVGYTWFNPIWPDPINYAGVMLNESITNNYEYYKRVAAAGHEFGHSLGLAHNDGEHLMETYIDIFYDEHDIHSPTSTDIAEVNARY